MLRAEIVNPPSRNDVEAVKEFMTDLVSHVRMKILSPARSIWCDEPGNEGITADVLLTTSNSVIHIWNYENNTGKLDFDLYSCAPFTPNEVIEFISSRFDIVRYVYRFIDRENSLQDISKT
jgi:S-adenosylmethionine/arginine decarboxylase-like enzyme